MKASPKFFAITNLIFALLFTYITYVDVSHNGWRPYSVLTVMFATSNYRSCYKMFVMHRKLKKKA